MWVFLFAEHVHASSLCTNMSGSSGCRVEWGGGAGRPSLTCLCLLQLPYFMNELTLTELDMGSATPRILKASKPSIDYRGKKTNALDLL